MYLGYYAIGIIKMFSLGGLFVLWLIDVVLIALQLLQPADGSRYIMNYYGPRVSALRCFSLLCYLFIVLLFSRLICISA
ncbi:hypothetical protein OESDEN_23516 [Oesophagostomum dentatum]|uniref:Uncharacterized protein n=1 Tax=Oesophagostomum dentatum TaxID=61180 RepID=A0A0B1RVZ8_OESDE|nr:hypothetical protein OESDEN_23516 [Oesophagostomum dentatum]